MKIPKNWEISLLSTCATGDSFKDVTLEIRLEIIRVFSIDDYKVDF